MFDFLSTPLPVVPFVIIMVATIFYSTFILDSGKAEIFKYRKNQVKNGSKNSFRVKFQENVNGRVKYSKREQIETLCLNAGFELSYSDYLLICICVALALFFVCLIQCKKNQGLQGQFRAFRVPEKLCHNLLKLYLRRTPKQLYFYQFD